MRQDEGGSLRRLIESVDAKLGVVGMGYVGLPLMALFARTGFKTLGFDVDTARVEMVNNGHSYIADVEEPDLESYVRDKLIEATSDYARLIECDAIVICVPTPFTVTKDPDISFVVSASESIQMALRPGQLVILRSTTFPETTEKVVQPILEKSGLKVGTDFYLAFSPERIDPGNRVYTVHNTPAVVGGVTPDCTFLSAHLLERCGIPTIQVSSPRVAEMSKLLENIFRSVNIALVNELARLCERMDNISIWEVIEAASSKPFGFMRFHPGPGIGGHCIPVDPYYLSWKAREYDFHTNFIELAAETNDGMPYFVATKVVEALSRRGMCASGSTVLLLGITFKEDLGDLRNSPALKVLEILGPKVSEIQYNDPFIESVEISGKTYRSTELKRAVPKADCVVITTAHSSYDYAWLVENARLVVDTRNGTKGLSSDRIERLGE